jgi:hypothetical protein
MKLTLEILHPTVLEQEIVEEQVSGRLSNLRTRLAKVERRLGDVARQEQLTNCNCKFIGATIACNPPEHFEAEMNRPCPAHGFRDLGTIICYRVVHAGGRWEDTTRLKQLVATYEARRARYQADIESEDAIEES